VAPNDLEDIQAKSLGQPIAFEPSNVEVPKIWEKLVPLEIKEQADEYQRSCKKQLELVARTANEASDLGRVMLESMNLPAAIEAVESNDRLPSDLWHKIEAIQHKGELRYLDSLSQEVKDASAGSYNVFNEISDMLDAELDEEKRMRKLYGMGWNRTPSEQVAAPYHEQLNEMRKHIQQASQADQKILQSLNAGMQSLRLLESSYKDLEARIPSASIDVLNSRESEAVRSALDELSSLFREREQLLMKLEKIAETNVMTKFVDAVNLTTAYDEEMKIFENAAGAVQQNVERQTAVLDRISVANENFLKTKNNNDRIAKREAVLQELNMAVELYTKIEKRFCQGRKFYLDLIANHLQPLHMNISGFVAARGAEKGMLVEMLNAKNPGGGGQAPKREAPKPPAASVPQYDDEDDDYPGYQ